MSAAFDVKNRLPPSEMPQQQSTYRCCLCCPAMHSGTFKKIGQRRRNALVRCEALLQASATAGRRAALFTVQHDTAPSKRGRVCCVGHSVASWRDCLAAAATRVSHALHSY
eukprot:5409509-Pleurochrysis_carterae.AAC.2